MSVESAKINKLERDIRDLKAVLSAIKRLYELQNKDDDSMESSAMRKLMLKMSHAGIR